MSLEARSDASLRVPSPRARRIMVADDDTDLRAVLVAALCREGYAVIEARDGQQALAEIGGCLRSPGESALPDLLIADIRMPGINGMSLLAGLRAADLTIPVILITGFGDQATGSIPVASSERLADGGDGGTEGTNR